MKQAIEEYWDARTKLVKSFRKINYRWRQLPKYRKKLFFDVYKIQREVVYKRLRDMDKLMGKVYRGLK